MNSTVLLANVDAATEFICTVVYPEDIDLIDECISRVTQQVPHDGPSV